MANSDDLYDSKTTYIIDAENAAEMARLIHQSQLVTKAMGSLFPATVDPSQIHDVLDIGCGPGGWVMDVASTYPSMRVQGIDISELMMEFARYEAQDKEIPNARFSVMNAMKPLDFPDDSFDLINTRFISSFMPAKVWPQLVKESWRILRPGGILCLTEYELAITSSSSFEKMNELFIQAMQLAGQVSVTSGRQTGFTAVVSGYLRDAGFQEIQCKGHAIDFSTGAEAHMDMYRDWRVAYKLVQPFLLKMAVTTQEEADVFYSRMVKDMEAEHFSGIWHMLSAWGQKPLQAVSR